MCNCKNNTHCVENVTVTDTNVALTVTNSTNISSLECFNLKVNGCISNRVSGAPLPVQIIVNGTAVSLLNKYSLQILSNHIPRRSRGAYVVPPNNGTPYVILFDTPPCKCFA
jgi:hypothetical protein